MTAPVLSILIPFYRDDPTPLLADLARQTGFDADTVEIIVCDDGTGDAALTQAITAVLKGRGSLIGGAENRGRAEARNALCRAARAARLLFLDADMRLPDSSFVATWLREIETADPDIAFGGFAPPVAVTADRALHRAFSQSADGLPAGQRAKDPARSLFTSNLLVKADILTACPFDNGFEGWGWEDMEWAARAAARYDSRHIDNPAVHDGLETAETLLERYRRAAGNFARLSALHPGLAARMPLTRWARRMKRLPGSRVLRPIFAMIARSPAPMAARVAALKLWRASWYGEALS